MNTTLRRILPGLLLALTQSWLNAASPTTAFTYQGRLFDGGVPANGLYDLQFTNYDAATAGNALGAFNTNAVPVSNGLFTVTLDFGPVFDGTLRWLDLSERTNGATAFATLAPRQLLAAAPYATYAASAGTASTVTGLTIQPNASGAPNVVAGSPLNFVASGVVGATIAGGGATNFIFSAYSNSVMSSFGTIGGGRQNAALSFLATVGGGQNNRASGQIAVVGGGDGNNATGNWATVSGGYVNTAGGQQSTVGGGGGNVAPGDWATVGGGVNNAASGQQAVVAGGGGNWATGAAASVAGGGDNRATFDWATIGGGCVNVAGGLGTVVGGGEGNASSGTCATVGGGSTNNATGDFTTISGGNQNTASGDLATVSGGEYNTANGGDAAVGGGEGNTASGGNAVVGGGMDNTASANWATVGGGAVNTGGGIHATVGGGVENTASGAGSFVGGGGDDGSTVLGNTAAGPGSTISGGTQNLATGSRSTIGGGHDNAATNWYATVPGGAWNVAGGQGSFAAGRAAKALHDGAFVWNDTGQGDLLSPAPNTVTIRASGGYQLFSSGSSGVTLAAGSGSWTSLSDRNAKENLAPVDAEDILAKVATLPLSTWNYRSQDPSVRHVGPMAQDFKAAFGVGESDTGITAVDAEGVALAAIQGLNQKLEEKNAALQKQLIVRDAQIQALQQSVAELRQAVSHFIQPPK